MDISKITAANTLGKNIAKHTITNSKTNILPAEKLSNFETAGENKSLALIEQRYRMKEATAKTLGDVQDFDFLV